MWVPGSLLTMPALFLAGTAASAHCALMCGAVSVHHARAAGPLPLAQALAWTHGGRILGYAVLGGLAGAAGQAILRFLPAAGLGRWIQLLAAAGLIGVGLRMVLARPAVAPCCKAPAPQLLSRWPLRAQLFARGLLWAALPCGLLYSVLLLSAISGGALSGGLLAGAFALGGVPLLAAIGWSGARRSLPARRLRTAGWGLVGLGAAAAAAVLLSHTGLAFGWCLPPA